MSIHSRKVDSNWKVTKNHFIFCPASSFFVFFFATRGHEWEHFRQVEKKSKKERTWEESWNSQERTSGVWERMKHVCLTKTIYIEPLALHEHTTK